MYDKSIEVDFLLIIHPSVQSKINPNQLQPILFLNLNKYLSYIIINRNHVPENNRQALLAPDSAYKFCLL